MAGWVILAGTEGILRFLQNWRNPVPFERGPNWRNMKKESSISERNEKDSCRIPFGGVSDWRNGKRNVQPSPYPETGASRFIERGRRRRISLRRCRDVEFRRAPRLVDIGGGFDVDVDVVREMILRGRILNPCERWFVNVVLVGRGWRHLRV